ncbi:phosphoribosylanthranilate isomerase [Aureimonas pseudogalii]|uniref:phosphoribosylanthranilate isomerase n=1 Tax=Aureimonas pseudogalii TaxID=1744844 RepID=UPI0016065023|nr:phosphoribosylanthranilate isomerase [Aureimonas pseudogalii]
MRPHIKICGLKSEALIDAVLARGCTEIGLMHFEPSPRHLPIEDMIRLRTHVGGRASVTVVTVDPSDELVARIAARVRPDTLQLHGKESIARVAEIAASSGLSTMKAISVATAGDLEAIAPYRAVADRILLDAKRPKGSVLPGGNGVSFDWALLDALGGDRDFILSGGLNADNIAEALRRIRPRGFDLSSGVETAPGVKDAGLVHRFFDAVDAALAAEQTDGGSAPPSMAETGQPDHLTQERRSA